MNFADQVYRFKCQVVLRAWMDHRCCAAKAARAIKLHRNQFMIWLKRARELGDE